MYDNGFPFCPSNAVSLASNVTSLFNVVSYEIIAKQEHFQTIILFILPKLHFRAYCWQGSPVVLPHYRTLDIGSGET